MLLEYIWVDADDKLRSKIRVIDDHEREVPIWSFDASLTGKSDRKNFEMILYPIKIYKCPFRKDKAFLILCTSDNIRQNSITIFDKYQDCNPMFDVVQEYYMIKHKIKSTNNYCKINSNSEYRALSEKHIEYCLYAGIKIFTINQELGPGQWSYQIGISSGIDFCDNLWMSRFILKRSSEEYNIKISFKPKYYPGYNGSACFLGFSTAQSRDIKGYSIMGIYMNKLSNYQDSFISLSGKSNQARLNSLLQNKFTWSNSEKNVSIRIGKEICGKDSCFFTDCRPGANFNPYTYCAMLVDVCCN